MLEAYEVIGREYIEDVHAEGTLLRHRKSGARIALLSNDDENKVFNIAFRTPPENSTGVAHIIEHTVLCGSRKFPLKDPFIELAKGSLNTFLNAMTYPDKTMFPVASCNDTDFRNLCDVYLDAVFYPAIYQNEKIFMQEGWHYHLENAEDPITRNGVVYNEMKGAFSSADDVLDRVVFETLFPDTPYGVESGGDPAVIPELTYEEFLAFHKKYYHPSNSYIYLYGNMDMEETLDWIDREYLSHFEKTTIDSEIKRQKPFDKPVFVEKEYPILDDEPEEANTYLTSSTVVGDYSDVTLNIALSVLEYVLLDTPGAPVKQALLDAGIGEDIDGSYDDGVLQPVFSVIARNAESTDRDRFLAIIHDTLEEQAEKGIDRKAILSGINYFEFRFREADFSRFPKGLIYGIDLFDSWLYDENKPFEYLKVLAIYDDLKKKANEGYFEDLIRSYLLDAKHSACVTLRPKKGLAAAVEAKTAEELAAYKASLSSEEIDDLVKKTRELKAFQEAEETEEALDTLPVLGREDIAKQTPVKLCIEEKNVDGTPYLTEKYFTNGIGYLTLLFDTKNIPNEYVPYLGILKSVLGMVSTENYSYGDLFHEINSRTGGISCGLQTYTTDKGEKGDVGPRMFGIRAKYLYPEQEFVWAMIREIITTSKFDEDRRIREILSGKKMSMQTGIPSAGHASAILRASSYQSETAAWNEKTSGIDHFRLVESICADFEKNFASLSEKLKELTRMVFRPENLTVSLTADGTGFDGVENEIRSLREVLYTDPVEKGSFEWAPDRKNEGFKTSGQVQYVAMVGNYRSEGLPYTGLLRTLHVMLNYEYLWTNIRTLGGAYGCMSNFRRTGGEGLVSYRDPHLKNTLSIFRGLPDYLKNFEADERNMTKYVIGTISELDTPMNAAALGDLALSCWYSHLTEEDFQKERDEILAADAAGIRALAPYAEAIVRADNICVIGSEAVIDRDRDALQSVEALVKG